MNRTNILKALPPVIILLLACAGTASAQMESDLHTCTVQEVLDSGGYSYIRCQEGSREIWLGVMETRLEIGELVSYPDTPPMINFRTKSLNRTFPEIRFVPGVSRAGAGSPESSPPPEATAATPDADQGGVYAGTDDSGALVFTDDPAKAPKGSRKKK